MYSHRTTITVFILVSLSYARGSGCARPQNCDNRLWSPWSSCDFPCGTWGTQSRTKINVQGCHEGCPYLTESRHCYGNLPVDCVLGVWSEWSSCSFHGRCNLSALQTSIRSKLHTEGCGGTCKDAVFEKTQPCRCLNGGTPMNGTCQCKEHYYGGCCMYKASKLPTLRWLAVLVVLAIVACCIYCCKKTETRGSARRAQIVRENVTKCTKQMEYIPVCKSDRPP